MMNRVAQLFLSLPALMALRFVVVYTLKKLFNPLASFDYSQTGEDHIIRSLLDETTPGIYVDVGCHDPIRSSNTLSLYLHGWHGLNIDANPTLVKRFEVVRRRDKAICAALSDRESDMVFHEFEDPLVSTLSADVLQEWQTKWKKRGERTVKTRTLQSILDEHLLRETTIDLLSIDVEGHDLNVLRSVDLNAYRPKLIVIEMHHLDLALTQSNEITRHLAENQFRLIGYDTLNGYFVDIRSPRAGLRFPLTFSTTEKVDQSCSGIDEAHGIDWV